MSTKELIAEVDRITEERKNQPNAIQKCYELAQQAAKSAALKDKKK